MLNEQQFYLFGHIQRYLNYKVGYSRVWANTGTAWKTGFYPWKTGFSHQVMSPGRSKIFSLRATFLSNCETKLGYCPSCHLGRYTPSPPYTSVSKRAVSRNR